MLCVVRLTDRPFIVKEIQFHLSRCDAGLQEKKRKAVQERSNAGDTKSAQGRFIQLSVAVRARHPSRDSRVAAVRKVTPFQY